MKINDKLAVSTSTILLVPYETAHVTTYHEWMQDKEIQELTASEPLSLEEEYEMQKKWRTDSDKLTFILCKPLPYPLSNTEDLPKVKGIKVDSPSEMLGDVNLFLYPSDKDEARKVIGELELMIALPKERRKGFGKAAIITFLHYIAMNIDQILHEYTCGLEPPRMSLLHHDQISRYRRERSRRMLQLKVKINEKNKQSLKLFERLGFKKVEEVPNYFREFELDLCRECDEAWTHELMKWFRYEGYEELEYSDGEVGERTVGGEEEDGTIKARSILMQL